MNYRNEVTWIIPEACHLFHYIVSPISSGINYRNEVTWIIPEACQLFHYIVSPVSSGINYRNEVTWICQGLAFGQKFAGFMMAQ